MKLSAEQMLNKYSRSTSHPAEVRRLAMMVFDEVNEKVHEMSNKDRKYLEAAALLHDIGYYIDSKGHNKHSMRMVIENGIDGFNEQDVKIIGCICRYHRGGLPDKEEHEFYNTLKKKDRKKVKRLAGILKICDGLDRGHLNLVKVIKINYDEENNIAEFILTPNTPEFRPDISSAIRKRDLFEIGFKCQSIIKFCE